MITRRRAVRAALVLVVVVLAGDYALRLIRSAPAPLRPAVRSTIRVPADRALDVVAVSPDGRWLSYSAETADAQLHLFLRAVTGEGDREVSESTGARNPFFSPDGKWIGYFARGAAWRVPVDPAGPPERICDAPTESAGGTWTPDERIVFAPLGGKGLMVVPAAGGTPEPLTTLNASQAELAHGWPHALPSGALIFTVAQRNRDPHLEALSAAGVRGPRLVPVLGQSQYVSTGHLVYSYFGNLLAVPFDEEELKPRGAPAVLARGVQASSDFEHLGHAGFAVSGNGTLAWIRSSPDDLKSNLVRVSFTGAAVGLNAPAEPYQTPRLSPDGRRLAVVVRSGLLTRDIRVLEVARPDRVLYTLQGGDNQAPAWMPDGRLSFASNRDGLQKMYSVASGGPGRQGRGYAPLFSTGGPIARNPGSWVRKPPVLAFYEIDPFRGRDVMVYRVGEAILPVAATTANERSPWLSPDGQSIAYVSDSSGRDQVYVKRLEDASDARQVSVTGGVEPVWTREGLIYREGDGLLRDGRILFAGRFEKDPGGNAAAYDVDPRGRELIMLKSARRPREVRVVQNWSSELAQQVPGR